MQLARLKLMYKMFNISPPQLIFHIKELGMSRNNGGRGNKTEEMQIIGSSHSVELKIVENAEHVKNVLVFSVD